MNITSMSGRELFTTLTGVELPQRSRAEKSEQAPVTNGPLRNSERDFFEDMGIKEYDTDSISSLLKTGLYSSFIGSNDHPDDSALAEHFGNIAKRLDEAYAAGKFTEEEYNELNSSLDEYIEKRTASAENTRAFYAVMKEEHGANVSQINEVKKVSSEEYMKDLKAKIDSFIEDRGAINRDILRQMINVIRYGAKL